MDNIKIATELVKLAKAVVVDDDSGNRKTAGLPMDFLQMTNVNADRYLRKDADNLFRAWDSMRSELQSFQKGKASTLDAEDAIHSVSWVIDELSKLARHMPSISRSMHKIIDAINKEEARRKFERENQKREPMTEEEFIDSMLGR